MTLLEGGLKRPAPLRRSFAIFSAWGDMLMNLIAYSAAISSCEKALPPPWFHGLGGQTHKPIWMWTVFGWHWHIWHVRFIALIVDLRCESSMVKWWFQTLFFLCVLYFCRTLSDNDFFKWVKPPNLVPRLFLSFAFKFPAASACTSWPEQRRDVWLPKNMGRTIDDDDDDDDEYYSNVNM